MSANTNISEGGKARPFGPVKALMVEGDDGKFYSWYPESEKALGTLSVDKNGVYRASDKGLYGWSSVYVNVATTDSVTGRDPDTGEEVVVRPDPETGELVETVVPVEIRVTTLPTKTEYADGETIDYTGIIVHAYSATGQDMGAVPFGELVFPVTTVQGGDEWSDGQGLNAQKIVYTPKPGKDNYGHDTMLYIGPVLGSRYDYPASYGSEESPATMLVTRYNNFNYALWLIGSKKVDLYMQSPWDGEGNYWHITGSRGGLWGEGAFEHAGWGEFLTNIPASNVDPATVDPANLHATQSLPVQWSRTGDGAILETSFSINITGGE